MRTLYPYPHVPWAVVKRSGLIRNMKSMFLGSADEALTPALRKGQKLMAQTDDAIARGMAATASPAEKAARKAAAGGLAEAVDPQEEILRRLAEMKQAAGMSKGSSSAKGPDPGHIRLIGDRLFEKVSLREPRGYRPVSYRPAQTSEMDERTMLGRDLAGYLRREDLPTGLAIGARRGLAPVVHDEYSTDPVTGAKDPLRRLKIERIGSDPAETERRLTAGLVGGGLAGGLAAYIKNTPIKSMPDSIKYGPLAGYVQSLKRRLGSAGTSGALIGLGLGAGATLGGLSALLGPKRYRVSEERFTPPRTGGSRGIQLNL